MVHGHGHLALVWDEGTFTAAIDLASFVGQSIDEVGVSVVDYTYVASNIVTVPWETPIAPPTVGVGASCDPDGVQNACEAPLACSPSLAGPHVCKASEAPVLHTVHGDSVFMPNHYRTDYVLEIVAEDMNADITAGLVTATTFTGRKTEETHVGSGAWVPAPLQDNPFFSGTFTSEGEYNPAPILEVALTDAAGNVSNTLKLTLASPLDDGAACDATSTVEMCDLSQDLVCGLDAVCELATAPVLDGVVMRRADSTTIELTIEGTDLNGDTLDAWVELEVDGTRQVLPSVMPVLSVLDMEVFTAVFTVALDDRGLDLPIDPMADVTLSVKLRDLAGLSSAAHTADVPQILEAGDQCPGDDTVAQCWEGAACVDGTCMVAPPHVEGMWLDWTDDTRRDALVTITGSDLSEDVTGFSVEMGDLVFETDQIPYEGNYGIVNTISWDGQRGFTIEAVLPGLGTGALIDVLDAFVSVTDRGDATASLLADIAPHRTIFDTCDVDGVLDECHASLVCADSECATDLADECAGIPVIDASAEGTPVEGSLAVAYDTSLGSEVHAYECAPYKNPRGKEIVVKYVADATGTVTVASAPTTGNGWLFARRDECVSDLSVADCSVLASYQGSNELALDVVVGDVLYITVDESYGSGAGDLTFTLE
ncbi:MAG: hypothetical protein JRI25_24145 [Deltaproteobacteria bacterium]|nr:hypothetical protein [Deltaproteobacteria bacterium]